MLFSNTETEKAIKIIESSAKTGMSSRDIVTQEVTEWLASDKRNMMLTGESYCLNHTNIQHERRTLVNGAEVLYRSNVRLEHSFYKKLVDQKVGYLLSKPPSVTTADDAYTQKLNQIFDRNFLRLLSIAGREAINKGRAWVQIYFKGDAIAFKLIPSEQIIPLWLDSAHTEINELIRVYEVMVYNGRTKELVRKVEHWSVGGVNFYEYTGGSLNESAYTVDTSGNIYRVDGTGGKVYPEVLGEKLKGAYILHNHPIEKTKYSFSEDDVGFFFENMIQYSKAFDDKFEYTMQRTDNTPKMSLQEVCSAFKQTYKEVAWEKSVSGEVDIDVEGYHETMKELSKRCHFIYRRLER